MESDAFFASADAGARLGGAPVALAFVDGLHLFEQALRDFLHVERHAARGSVVLFHDCLPLDRATSARERRTGFWSGDVWKLLPILREHRPDLDAFVIPAYPTGLGVVTRLDPSSTRLDGERLEEITRSWVPREWSDAPGAAPALRVRRAPRWWRTTAPRCSRASAGPLLPAASSSSARSRARRS